MGLACLLWGVLGSLRVIHQPRLSLVASPGDFQLPYEAISLSTSDRIVLKGWWIRHPHANGVLMLLHGFGTGKADLLDLAKALHTQGSFHLILIDHRGHGESHGSTLSFGKKEILDILATLEFVDQNPALQDLPVGCLGVSMGGAIGILAASRLPQIRGVVSDSSYADLAHAIARTQWLTYHIPRIPLGQVVIWATEIRLMARMRQLSPVTAIRKISPRPVLIIHGMEDRGIPSSEAAALFQAAGEPKQLWLVPEAEHLGAFYRNRQEYVQRIVDFFNDAFQRAP